MRGAIRLLGLVCVSAWLLPSAEGGEIWKCQQGAQIKYSDRPCPADGDALPARALQPNVVAGERPASDSQGPRLVGNVCPDEVEIAAMAHRATASTLGPAEHSFFMGEIARARECRQGRGRYTAADWALSRQAQAAQGLPGLGAEARRRIAAQRAEPVPSAAAPSSSSR